MTDNPFFEPWTTPYGAPPFDRIEPDHFRPAYDRALAEHAREIAAIANSAAPPSFTNTIVALEDSGQLLRKVEAVFHNLASSYTNDAIQAIERDMAPVLAKHWNDIYLNDKLFARIDTLHEHGASLEPRAEERRVLERYHLDFVRAGAKLKGEAKTRLAAVVEELASLGTQFGQNVLGDEQDFVLPLNEDDMKGVPAFAREAAAEIAKERGLDAPYAATTSRSSAEPILQFADNRTVREKIFAAWTSRGDNANAHNNTAIIEQTTRLRAERAKLLGYANFAAFKLADTMAKTPENARHLLDQVWAPARRRSLEERDALQDLIAREGGNFKLAAWDWRYYAEKLRKERYDLDDAEVMPYFQLEKMIEAAFFTAHKLFGLDFAERKNIPAYHPDVRVWEVTRGGAHVGLFYGDYFARSSKRSGAWMSSFRDQENMTAPVTPLIVNNCNFPKGDPALLSFDEAETLFHEFGHALHGLLSQVHYPRLSGTNVATDFVELPSQIFEHWLETPEILERFAVHAETGKPIPRTLIDKLTAARNFNQGFATVEFLASAFVDLDFHTRPEAATATPKAFQAEALARIGMPEEIVMRHASPHFAHIFAGDGYSAGYYSYLWSEVLDADGFDAFKEAKNVFDPATAKRLHDYVYAAGGTRDFAEAYRLFRGRDPKIDALLQDRGLAA
jgi:peptidyl-dipeptidase Dcp